MRLEVAPAALKDLKEIVRYVARDNQDAARRIELRLLGEFRIIAERPFLFMPVFLVPRFRRNIVGKYEIIFQIVNDEIVRIERIMHGMRDLPRHLR
jgi:toxin ParE1/3/4